MGDEPLQPQTQPAWTRGFDTREQAQIAHARHYAATFSISGVPGHGQFLLIAKLAALLDEREPHANA
jgi:hypothetical protein